MMFNEEFQNTVREGDVLLTETNSMRFRSGDRYEFIKFGYCRHAQTQEVDGCVGCDGQVKYIDILCSAERKTDCLREYEDGRPSGKLIIMAEIIKSKWLEEDDFLI